MQRRDRRTSDKVGKNILFGSLPKRASYVSCPGMTGPPKQDTRPWQGHGRAGQGSPTRHTALTLLLLTNNPSCLETTGMREGRRRMRVRAGWHTGLTARFGSKPLSCSELDCQKRDVAISTSPTAADRLLFLGRATVVQPCAEAGWQRGQLFTSAHTAESLIRRHTQFSLKPGHGSAQLLRTGPLPSPPPLPLAPVPVPEADERGVPQPIYCGVESNERTELSATLVGFSPVCTLFC
ncbi:hypothetical protein BKA65DRAFT_585968 [Rhexocercosporidium sp. MPI-PUGE-AT-0058]|nr:hypothetical protein BKA65DRAFT_585968 [Rhexocercosporidium sp. MPI-PUGE-AT-0058]